MPRHSRQLLSLCFLALVPALHGCAHSFDATRVGVPVTMASANAAPPAGEPFSVTQRAVYVAWGTIQIREASLQKALAGQLVDGTSIADLRIKVRSRLSDVLITGLTLGILTPRAVTYEGVVVGRSR
ncbi:MAG: hypothetical protein ACREMH_07615 [Gemmatimonadales bacterium]